MDAVRRGGADSLLVSFARSLVVVLAILIAVGVAWLVINRVHPEWLADAHLPYTSSGVAAAPGGTKTPAASKSTPPTAAPARRPAGRR